MIKGKLCLYYDEDIYSYYLSVDTKEEKIVIQEKDYLIIYSKNKNILWKGEVKYDPFFNYYCFDNSPFTYPVCIKNNKIIYGNWINLQIDVCPHIWISYFLSNHECSIKLH